LNCSQRLSQIGRNFPADNVLEKMAEFHQFVMLKQTAHSDAEKVLIVDEITKTSLCLQE